jgi:hypothetical protein
MTAEVLILDPSDPAIRAEARELANQLVKETSQDTQVSRLIRTILDDIAGGQSIVVLRADEDVTLLQAARILGVASSFIEGLMANGALPFHQLPNSTELRVKVSDALALAAEQKRRQLGHAIIRDILEETGFENN